MEEEEFFRRYPNQTKAWYERCKEKDYFSNAVYFPELVREKYMRKVNEIFPELIYALVGVIGTEKMERVFQEALDIKDQYDTKDA